MPSSPPPEARDDRRVEIALYGYQYTVTP
jgi:hypothetical protein